MQGRGGKARACGVSMQGGYVYIADHLAAHAGTSGSLGARARARQWNTRTPAAPCARRFCGSFFRRASHSQPAGPRTARAGRGARSGDPSPHLSGPDWSPRPHGRPAGASGLNVAPRPARLCPHTHPHTHPHTRPHNTTLMQTTAKGGQRWRKRDAPRPSAPSSDGTRMPTHQDPHRCGVSIRGPSPTGQRTCCPHGRTLGRPPVGGPAEFLTFLKRHDSGAAYSGHGEAFRMTCDDSERPQQPQQDPLLARIPTGSISFRGPTPPG